MRFPTSSRRRFLATSAAALAAANLPKSLLAERIGGDLFTPGSLSAYAQGTLTQATFEKLIGTEFRAFLENHAVAYMRLERVTGSGTPTAAQKTPTIPDGQIVTFQTTFSTGGANFNQGTYLLDHGALGRFACFLVPSDPAGGATCTATFCYLSSAVTRQPTGPSAPVKQKAPQRVPSGVNNPLDMSSAPGPEPKLASPSARAFQSLTERTALNLETNSSSPN